MKITLLYILMTHRLTKKNRNFNKYTEQIGKSPQVFHWTNLCWVSNHTYQRKSAIPFFYSVGSPHSAMAWVLRTTPLHPQNHTNAYNPESRQKHKRALGVTQDGQSNRNYMRSKASNRGPWCCSERSDRAAAHFMVNPQPQEELSVGRCLRSDGQTTEPSQTQGLRHSRAHKNP